MNNPSFSSSGLSQPSQFPAPPGGLPGTRKRIAIHGHSAFTATSFKSKPWLFTCCLAGAFAGVQVCFSQSPGTLTTLLSFSGTNGSIPFSSILEASDGNFYGTTRFGGAYDKGTVFQVTPAGVFTSLISFDGTNGSQPFAGLVQGTNGLLYGTTAEGGVAEGVVSPHIASQGTIFAMTLNGDLRTLVSFYPDFADTNYRIAQPYAPLTLGGDGNFYGTTIAGGRLPPLPPYDLHFAPPAGVIFRLTHSGELTPLSYFDGTNGAEPYVPVIQGSDGNFYGTTSGGAPKGPFSMKYGVKFKMTPEGLLTWSYVDPTNFGGACSSLREGWDGNFYGTTEGGGPLGGGILFRMSPDLAMTCLISFEDPSIAVPIGGLILANDGNLYGTTLAGGTYRQGTIFRVSSEGVLTRLFSFDGTNGTGPVAALAQAKNGDFYGTARTGGAYGLGTIFRFRAPPIVNLQDVSSQVEVTRSGLRYNRATQRFVQTAILKNIGPSDISGPIILSLDGLTSNAMLYNSTSTSGKPCININLGIDGILQRGEISTVVLEFSNPGNQGIRYSTRALTEAPSEPTSIAPNQ